MGRNPINGGCIRNQLELLLIGTQDSFYNTLTPEQSVKAFKNEFDFDAPQAIDFDLLVEKLRDLKSGYSRRQKPTQVPAHSTETRK